MPVQTDVIKRLIPLADAHKKADEYVSGTYWEGNGEGKGCAVGCTIHDAVKLGVLPKGTNHDSHESIAAATGLPEMVWRLADHIFEGLSDEDRPCWTPRFLRAAKKCISPDAVPSRIMSRLAKRLAEDAIREDVRKTCLVVAELWDRRARGDEPSEKDWDAAREQADAARKQADAAWEQADAAREKFWRWCADVVVEELTRSA